MARKACFLKRDEAWGRRGRPARPRLGGPQQDLKFTIKRSEWRIFCASFKAHFLDSTWFQEFLFSIAFSAGLQRGLFIAKQRGQWL